jgi:hypothetical protein
MPILGGAIRAPPIVVYRLSRCFSALRLTPYPLLGHWVLYDCFYFFQQAALRVYPRVASTTDQGWLRGDHHAADGVAEDAGRDPGRRRRTRTLTGDGCGARTTCSDQEGCFTFSDVRYCEGTGDTCSSCQRKVCVDRKPDCCKTGTISHVGVAITCFPSNPPFSESNADCGKKGEYAELDAAMCQVVDPGTVAKFVIKDGNSGTCAAGGGVQDWTCGPNAGPPSPVVSF